MAAKRGATKKQEDTVSVSSSKRNSAKEDSKYVYNEGTVDGIPGGFSIVEVELKSGVNLEKLKAQLKKRDPANEAINLIVLRTLDKYFGFEETNVYSNHSSTLGKPSVRAILFLKELGILED